VKAYNAGGTSAASQTATVATSGWTAPAPTPTPAPAPNASGMNKSALVGMVPNPDQPRQAIPQLKELGMKSVRLWYGVRNWSDGVNSWNIDSARQYKAAGFTVVLAVNTPSSPTTTAPRACSPASPAPSCGTWSTTGRSATR
jgi:hypothetical protein